MLRVGGLEALHGNMLAVALGPQASPEQHAPGVGRALARKGGAIHVDAADTATHVLDHQPEAIGIVVVGEAQASQHAERGGNRHHLDAVADLHGHMHPDLAALGALVGQCHPIKVRQRIAARYPCDFALAIDPGAFLFDLFRRRVEGTGLEDPGTHRLGPMGDVGVQPIGGGSGSASQRVGDGNALLIADPEFTGGILSAPRRVGAGDLRRLVPVCRDGDALRLRPGYEGLDTARVDAGSDVGGLGLYLLPESMATAAAVSMPSAIMHQGARLALPQITARPAVLSSPARLADFFGSRTVPLAAIPRSAFPAPSGAT